MRISVLTYKQCEQIIIGDVKNFVIMTHDKFLIVIEWLKWVAKTNGHVYDTRVFRGEKY